MNRKQKLINEIASSVTKRLYKTLKESYEGTAMSSEEFLALIEQGQTDFGGYNLEGLILKEVELPDQINFTQANLHRARFSDVTCRGVIFDETDLSEVVFKVVDATGAVISNTNFSNANCYHFIANNAEISYGDWLDAIFLNSKFDKSSFDDVEFINTTFINSTMLNANFNDIFIDFATFLRCNLTGITFDSGRLSNTTFDNSKLQKATFSELDMEYTIFDKSPVYPKQFLKCKNLVLRGEWGA